MDRVTLIERLIQIKLSIIEGAPDTMFMRLGSNTTICEELDLVLIELGVRDRELMSHYEMVGRKPGDHPDVWEK